MIVRQQRGPPRSRQRGSALPERFQDGDGRRSAPWDTATGTLRTTLTGHGGYATLLPDGRYKLDGVAQGPQQMTIKSGQSVLLQEQVNITGTTMTVDRVLP